MDTQLQESTYCQGIYHTIDERFYAAQTEIQLRPRGAHAVLQYLTTTGGKELVRLYVDDLTAAQQLVEQIIWGRGERAWLMRIRVRQSSGRLSRHLLASHTPRTS